MGITQVIKRPNSFAAVGPFALKGSLTHWPRVLRAETLG
jgi:hypothetical protein